MHLLRIEVSGVPQFKEGLDVSFIAEKKVYEADKDNLFHLFSNIYLNFTNVICGINASGKTSFLRLVSFITCLLCSEPLNHIADADILGKCKDAKIISYFYASKKIFKLETIINSTLNSEKISYEITEERLYVKNVSSVKGKIDLFNFDKQKKDCIRRSKIDEKYLPKDISIVIGLDKKIKGAFGCVDTMPSTNFNLSSILNIANIPERYLLAIVKFFDPTIKTFKVSKTADNEVVFKFSFKNGNSYTVENFTELEHYLSSGTIKGIPVFSTAIDTLNKGVNMIMDEIENHFNKEICIMLIRLFTDKTINKKGSVLFFSTHYPEILDEFGRSDNIFVASNDGCVSVDGLHKRLEREDIKKSEAFKSGLIGGTVPSYDAYLEFKNSFRESHAKAN